MSNPMIEQAKTIKFKFSEEVTRTMELVLVLVDYDSLAGMCLSEAAKRVECGELSNLLIKAADALEKLAEEENSMAEELKSNNIHIHSCRNGWVAASDGYPQNSDKFRGRLIRSTYDDFILRDCYTKG